MIPVTLSYSFSLQLQGSDTLNSNSYNLNDNLQFQDQSLGVALSDARVFSSYITIAPSATHTIDLVGNSFYFIRTLYIRSSEVIVATVPSNLPPGTTSNTIPPSSTYIGKLVFTDLGDPISPVLNPRTSFPLTILNTGTTTANVYIAIVGS